MSTKTNQRTFIDLVGFESTTLNDNILPVNRDVLSQFFYKHRTEKLKIRESAQFVLNEVVNIWKKFMIPVISSHYSILKIEKLYRNWQRIQANKSRKKSVAQNLRQEDFVSSLDNLFDIAPKNVLEFLSSPQKEFLIDSRDISKTKTLLRMTDFYQEEEEENNVILGQDHLTEITSQLENDDINSKGKICC